MLTPGGGKVVWRWRGSKRLPPWMLKAQSTKMSVMRVRDPVCRRTFEKDVDSDQAKDELQGRSRLYLPSRSLVRPKAWKGHGERGRLLQLSSGLPCAAKDKAAYVIACVCSGATDWCLNKVCVCLAKVTVG